MIGQELYTNILGGSPCPICPVCAQKWPKARLILFCVKRWIRVKQYMPQALRSSVECMNISKQLVFILSVLNCAYVRELIQIYEEILNFIYFMSSNFRQLIR